MYELIDKELKEYSIDGHKYMFLVCLCVSLILSVLSIFYTVTLVLSVIFAIIALIFCISWNSNKKIYGKNLLYTNDTIKIYVQVFVMSCVFISPEYILILGHMVILFNH